MTGREQRNHSIVRTTNANIMKEMKVAKKPATEVRHELVVPCFVIYKQLFLHSKKEKFAVSYKINTLIMSNDSNFSDIVYAMAICVCTQKIEN